jgi:hypothetical protein
MRETLVISQGLGVFFALSALAQGTFQNLNFEEAIPNPYSGSISAANAIPDWTAEIGGVPQTQIVQNFFSTGDPEVVLITPNNPQLPPLEGSYSVLLTGSFIASASISQTGLIPAGTQSLLFDAESEPGSETLALLIGSQTVPFVPVATEPNYTVYGANISAWGGHTETLT